MSSYGKTGNSTNLTQGGMSASSVNETGENWQNWQRYRRRYWCTARTHLKNHVTTLELVSVLF
jgi:hypothetical protein